MLAVFSLVAPIFGLIGLGLLTAKIRWLDASAGRILAQFGYKVAMPALLFRTLSSVGMPEASPLSLIASYVLAITATWLLATLATRVILRRPAGDAPSIAMGSCFGNGVMLGIPLLLGAFGNAAATPIAVLVTIETIYLWVLATLHMEVASRGIGSISFGAVWAILRDVATNPMVASITLGIAWAATGLTIPPLADRLLALLAQSAVPVSLFALGMTLAAYGIAGQIRTLSLILILKMAIYPAMALLLAHHVFELPPAWTAALLVFTSMPVGANAFVFAARYDRAIGSVSAAVAVSTAIAVVSVTAILAVLQIMGLVATP
ncbi:MAG: AEC family transporter [Hyphomicrobiaceae bacterium]